MKFALIPWTSEELQDGIFIRKNAAGTWIPTESAAYLMQQEFFRLGHELHTYDCYPDWSEVDFFLLYSIDWIAAERITRAGYAEKMVYCNAEPPTVCSLHTREGYEILKQIFPKILTWNPDWTDNRQVFKRCIPYYYKFSSCEIPFQKRKLITGISANKHSDYPEELYTERERAYDYFEKNYPDQFDFYGILWEGTAHPCYRGTVKDKAEVFHKYKFAICFENTRTKRDYITEKIWDCLNAQIVPIYAGAENIRDYIPENCFISFDRFDSYDALAKFLMQMSEEEYQKYLDAALQLLHSDVIDRFSGEQYAHDILAAVEQKNDFQMTGYGRNFLAAKARKEQRALRRIRIRMTVKRIMGRNKNNVARG